MEPIGVEIDDILIRLAYVNANLQAHPVQLFNQDSLEPLFIDPVDAVVCDLPVGYYPNDSRAADYQLKAVEGHSLFPSFIHRTKCSSYTARRIFIFYYSKWSI